MVKSLKPQQSCSEVLLLFSLYNKIRLVQAAHCPTEMQRGVIQHPSHVPWPCTLLPCLWNCLCSGCRSRCFTACQQGEWHYYLLAPSCRIKLNCKILWVRELGYRHQRGRHRPAWWNMEGAAHAKVTCFPGTQEKMAWEGSAACPWGLSWAEARLGLAYSSPAPWQRVLL